MALFNHDVRDVKAKIVYFGPGFSGKETSITHIYRTLNPEARSVLKAMTMQGSRALFFDFCPEEQELEGYGVRFYLYTLVDAVLKQSTWQSLLTGVDGVVFVADSDPARHQDNLDCLRELASILAGMGSGIDQIPLVIQYNRRDHPAAMPLEELQRQLNSAMSPGFPTTATTGDGVMAPFTSIVRMILSKLREELAIETAVTVEIEVELEEEPMAEAEIVAEVEESRESVTEPAHEEDGRGDDIRLELSGGGSLTDGLLTIPVTVTAGTGRREYRLVISLAGVEAREG